MAYNKQDVTSFTLDDIASGSLIRVPGGFTTPPDLDWAFVDEPTAVYLGELGEDGVDVEPSADDNDKKTMDRNHGKVYSNYMVTTTIRCASSTDPDVLALAFGGGNVSTTAGGATKAVLALTQPTADGYIILGKTDDGRRFLFVITDGKVDPNISFTLVNTDITVFELDILSSSGDAYILSEPVE